MCRHWRGVLLKHGALWSQLFLGKGEECLSTLLERAKGSALDIITDWSVPDGITTLISPRAQRIAYLEFVDSYWRDVIAFSELDSGQLPLLHTLKIKAYNHLDPDGEHIVPIPPSLRFFKGSINLQQFELSSSSLTTLSHFTFPSLTTFKLPPSPSENFNASYLFDFLKASPLLETVEMNIVAEIDLSDIPQEMVVVLPNVKIFSLHVPDNVSPQVFDVASHISCPCAQSTSLTHHACDDQITTALEAFPSPAVWDRIVRQYTASPVEEVTLEAAHSEGETDCFLTLRCSDTTVVSLGFILHETGANEGDLVEIGWEIFSQALATIQNLLALSYVKRLHIKQRADMPDKEAECMETIVKLAKSQHALGVPLERVTVRTLGLHPEMAKELGRWVAVVDCDAWRIGGRRGPVEFLY